MLSHEHPPRLQESANFELGQYCYPASDIEAPMRAIADEQHRLTTTARFPFHLARAHAFAPEADMATLYVQALEAMELEVQDIMNTPGDGRRLHCTAVEQKYLQDFLDISGPTTDKAILERWNEREEFFTLALYAATFGLSFAEASEDFRTKRAPDPRYEFPYPKYLTALRRQVSSGGNPELALWRNRIKWLVGGNNFTEI